MALFRWFFSSGKHVNHVPGKDKQELARLAGFEPATNGFGSHYSIQLSYRRFGDAHNTCLALLSPRQRWLRKKGSGLEV